MALLYTDTVLHSVIYVYNIPKVRGPSCIQVLQLSLFAFRTGIWRLHYVIHPASGREAASSSRSVETLSLFLLRIKGFVCVWGVRVCVFLLGSPGLLKTSELSCFSMNRLWKDLNTDGALRKQMEEPEGEQYVMFPNSILTRHCFRLSKRCSLFSVCCSPFLSLLRGFRSNVERRCCLLNVIPNTRFYLLPLRCLTTQCYSSSTWRLCLFLKVADGCYCAGCGGEIQDSFRMKVLQDTWHNACFQ